MIEPITEDQVKEYVNNQGRKCPYCKAPGVKAVRHLEQKDDQITQVCNCWTCTKMWTDHYRLDRCEAIEFDYALGPDPDRPRA